MERDCLRGLQVGRPSPRGGAEAWGRGLDSAPAELRPQAGSFVRERARSLAAGGDGCAGLASPLPPRLATGSALQTAPGAPADGLRRRTSKSAQLEKSLEQNAGVPAPESQFLIKVSTTVPPTFSGSEKVAYQGLQTLEGPSRRQMQSGFGRRRGPAWICASLYPPLGYTLPVCAALTLFPESATLHPPFCAWGSPSSQAEPRLPESCVPSCLSYPAPTSLEPVVGLSPSENWVPVFDQHLIANIRWVWVIRTPLERPSEQRA